MATSHFKTLQYSSENFVESAGAILFHRSSRRICLVHYAQKDEWLLAKGRRNVGESLPEAAVREAREETGYTCRPLPVDMTTRAPPADETGDSPDEARLHERVCEPFMVTCRLLKDEQALKLITWFIAEVDEDVAVGNGETQFQAELFDFDQCLEKLTFQTDRDIVQKAVDIFETTYPSL